MTRERERKALNRLADALVDDVLDSSDEELLAEAEEDGIDAPGLAEHLRGVFEHTVAEILEKRSSPPPDRAPQTPGNRARAW